ncbi:MAG: type I-U CRISPR-associated helicase/endonuclease Cas3 [Zavarzinella sp.]
MTQTGSGDKMERLEFATTFELLTGNKPFPWQEALYERFKAGSEQLPKSCILPTGLGKTSVIAIWLIAFANGAKVPRRLVYVVNRRTVVDQTTEEVESYKKKTVAGIPDFGLSTLRGQFADNREWCADPSRPAVICGTVDMIGSRLLFSGYGLGMKARPLHAGFLGQDVLLVHDEAHLEPAFQTLIMRIEEEQKRENAVEFGIPKFQVMELTATPRQTENTFPTPEEKIANSKHPEVSKRLNAAKKLNISRQVDEKKLLVKELTELALSYSETTNAILVFTRTVENVMLIAEGIAKQLKLAPDEKAKRIVTLTGTMRGKERDGLIQQPVFQRFLNKNESGTEAVWLICTSAGEVGVNISADHLISDLSTFDSMAQRFGRVNRFGRTSSEITVVMPDKFEKNSYDEAREKTAGLLAKLAGDASPAALGLLDLEECKAAFAPAPTILTASDILFDSWSLTTIKGKLPGRPDVEPYLHGLVDNDYDTEFAWRTEVALLTSKASDELIEEILTDHPLRPHEKLRIPTYGKVKATDHLEKIRERSPDLPVWVIEPNGEVKVFSTMTLLLEKRGKDYLQSFTSRTIILPPAAGGLTSEGMLNGEVKVSAELIYDVADLPPEKVEVLPRLHLRPNENGDKIDQIAPVRNWTDENTMQLRRKSVLVDGESYFILDRYQFKESESDEVPLSEYLVVKKITDKKEKPAQVWPGLDVHNQQVGNVAKEIAEKLHLSNDFITAVELAGSWHDLGKARSVWQRGAGNSGVYQNVAKTLHGRAPEKLNSYRHELGSMVDVQTRTDLAEEFDRLNQEQQDLVLHLIATHHGRGRPHFPVNESRVPESDVTDTQTIVTELPARFARLQRKYGRWGLAFLESILRAADVKVSRELEKTLLPDEDNWVQATSESQSEKRRIQKPQFPSPTITVTVDPTNPGQVFACCGLLELADRIWPGAEGWFSKDATQFHLKLSESITILDLVDKLVCNPAVAVETLDNGLVAKPIIAPLQIKLTSEKLLCLDGWTRVSLIKGNAELIGNTPWNFWSGNQKSAGLWSALRHELMNQITELTTSNQANLLSMRLFQKGRFGFDPGPAWNALDVGFSPNEQGMQVQSSPAVELLAAVGLQRHRPQLNETKDGFDYFSWHIPLSAVTSPAAFAGAINNAESRGYRASVVSRGEYAALSFSFQLISGEFNE